MTPLTRNVLSFLCLTLGCFMTYAQTNDALPERQTQLQEVTVRGRTVRPLGPGQYRITPLPDQKRLASNLIDVLANVNTSLLHIDRQNMTVQMSDGQSVAIFINGFPASKEQLQGMLPGMVKYADLLENPADPRYGGAKYAVNFVLRDRTGGFTKISLEDRFLNGNYNEGGIFNHNAHGKMTWSFFAGGTNTDIRHGGVNSTEEFPWLRLAGTTKSIGIPERISETTDFSSRTWSVPVTARYTYTSQKFMMHQTIGYSHDSRPHTDVTGVNTYYLIPREDAISGVSEEPFSRHSSRRTNSVNWSSMYYALFPKTVWLNLMTTVSYSHNNSSSVYSAGADRISNPARENALRVSALATISKRWTTAHTLSATGIFSYSHHDIDYFSGNGSNRYSFPSGSASLKYYFYTKKIYLQATAGVEISTYDVSRTEEVNRYTSARPILGLDITLPVRKTQLSVYASYKQGALNTSIFTPEIRRLDEIMYFTGNPDIKVEKRFMTGARATWAPSRIFSMTPSLGYMKENGHNLETYAPYRDGIIRTYTNIRSYDRISGNVAAALNLLENRLSINGNIFITSHLFSGVDIPALTSVHGYLSASFSKGDFRWDIRYDSPQKSRDAFNGAKVTLPCSYNIGCSWYHGPWSLGVTLDNIFRTSWKQGESVLVTPYYVDNRESFGTDYHARCTVKASFNFGYGKKVRPREEVGRSAYESSAILE